MDLPKERTFKAGETVIEQGEPAMEAYLVISGHAEIHMNGAVLATLGEGEIFGERAFFKGSDYGATVKAADELTLQPITPAILDEKIRQCDPMIRAIMRMLMVRLRKSNEAVASFKA